MKVRMGSGRWVKVKGHVATRRPWTGPTRIWWTLHRKVGAPTLMWVDLTQVFLILSSKRVFQLQLDTVPTIFRHPLSKKQSLWIKFDTTQVNLLGVGTERNVVQIGVNGIVHKRTNQTTTGLQRPKADLMIPLFTASGFYEQTQPSATRTLSANNVSIGTDVFHTSCKSSQKLFRQHVLAKRPWGVAPKRCHGSKPATWPTGGTLSWQQSFLPPRLAFCPT